jgi:hypothetical protein
MRVDAAPQRHKLGMTLPSTYTSVKPCESDCASHIFEVDGEEANN